MATTFMYSSVDEYLSCCHLLAIMNHTAMNIHVQVYVWTYVFISHERDIPRSGLYSEELLNFHKVTTLCNTPNSNSGGGVEGRTILVSLHPHQHLFSVFIEVSLVDVEWYLMVGLICSSLVMLLSIFKCASCPCVYLWRNILAILSLFFHWVVHLLLNY